MPATSSPAKTSGRHVRRHTAKARATTANTDIAGMVSPRMVPTSAGPSSDPVRWSANHREMSLSHGSTDDWSEWVISQPTPMTAARIKAQARTRIPIVAATPHRSVGGVDGSVRTDMAASVLHHRAGVPTPTQRVARVCRMVTVGGPEVMLLGALLAGLACALLGLGLARLGAERPWAVAGLLWSVVVIGLVTLLPTDGSPGWIPIEDAQDACSYDYGGPAPEGFWIFGGGQRLLNTLLFVPAGMFLAVATLRRGTRWLAVPGLLALAAYSVAIERVQLELTRLDRACDVTDIVDNVTGALIGFGLGILVAGALGLGRRT